MLIKRQKRPTYKNNANGERSAATENNTENPNSNESTIMTSLISDRVLSVLKEMRSKPSRQWLQPRTGHCRSEDGLCNGTETSTKN